MRDKERAFGELSKIYFATSSHTATEQAAYEAECIAYKKAFTDAASLNIIDHTIPQVLGLKVQVGYMKLLENQGKYKAVIKEAEYANNIFFRFIYFYEKDEARCSRGSGSTMVLTKDHFQTAASPFLCMAINAAFEIENPASACWYFMAGIYNDGFKRSGEVNKAAGQVMQYRLSRKWIDDTTFMAAYTYLNTMYTEKTLAQMMAGLAKFPENDAIKVITDPLFVKHKMPEVRRAQYAYYPDAAYFQDLYEYLKGRDSVDSNLEQAVLKMLLKVYYANDKKGIDVIHLSNALRCCVRSDETGTKAIPEIQKIIDAGDRELMQLLADFIRQAYNKSDFYPDEDYGAYLLYRALGDEKAANKMYNSIEKRVRGSYIKL